MPTHLSRRTVLGAALGTAAAVASTRPAHAATPSLRAAAPARADVVVVGAGLAGLSATRTLLAQGVDAILVEARDRVGGRVHNATTVGGSQVDGGAEFVGPTQNEIIALADHFGVPRLDTYNTGSNVWYYENKASRYPAWGIPLDLGTIGAARVITEIDLICASFPVGRPWEHAFASLWDAITWKEWVDRRVLLPSARAFLYLAATSTLSVRPDRVSALYVLGYIAAAGTQGTAGSFFRLLNVKDGAQAQFFDGGAARIPLAMGAELGDRVVLSAPTRAIRTTTAGADVVTDAGTIAARRVVVAMSPAICGQIAYEPGLSAARAALHREYRMGRIGKFFAVYDTPWWRDLSLTGQTIGTGVPADVTFESYGDGRHVLMGFVSGDAMESLDDATPETIRDRVIENFVAYFGEKARSYIDWGVFRWDREEWSHGGPVAVTMPGTLTKNGRALREPVGPIHWAGTETSDYWTGYMDGAVRSGYRVAAEVTHAL